MQMHGYDMHFSSHLSAELHHVYMTRDARKRSAVSMKRATAARLGGGAPAASTPGSSELSSSQC